MDEDELDDDPSTLVRSGKLALTYTEMAALVEDIEARPIERLADLCRSAEDPSVRARARDFLAKPSS